MPKRKPFVLAVVASARKKGNCDTLCDRVLAGARSVGAQVEKVYLNDLDIRPCRGCAACQERRRLQCAVEDDMRELYPRLRKCDALVLATPIYFFTMSAQMKVFIDKTYPLSRPKGSEVGAKRAVVCLTYGADDILDSGCVNAVHTFGDIFNYMGIRASYVHASAWKKGDILKNRAALRQAFERGKEAVRGLAGR